MTQPTSAGRRRASPKGERRKAEIVDAAMEAIARAGYEKCSVASIAAHVGLSVPGLLHHFPSKDHLLIAMLEKRDADAANFVVREGQDWRTFLRALVPLLRDHLANPGLVAAFALLAVESLHEEHPAAEWFSNRSVAAVTAIEGQLRRGLEDKTMMPDADITGVAHELIAVLDGLQQQWLREKRAINIEALFDAYVERLISALAAK